MSFLKNVGKPFALVAGLTGGAALFTTGAYHLLKTKPAQASVAADSVTADPAATHPACTLKLDLLQEACLPTLQGASVEVCVKVAGKHTHCMPVEKFSAPSQPASNPN